MNQAIALQLAKELNLNIQHVESVMNLLDEGNTIPFIARYRKEMTGKMSDVTLRELFDRLTYLTNLASRKEEIKRLLIENEHLTPELDHAISVAGVLSELEDIYRPFKPKRRTRATIAKEKGLDPLAELMLTSRDEAEIEAFALSCVDGEKGVETLEEALLGAQDILAETFSDMANLRAYIRDQFKRRAILVSEKGKEPDETGVYQIYHDYQEPVHKIPAHRILAINRAERENILKVKLLIDHDELIDFSSRALLSQQLINAYVTGAYHDGYKRLIVPAIEREIRNELTEQAEEQAIKIFGVNLKQLLLQPPLKGKVVMGFDPAYRTGCKLSVRDAFGKLQAYDTIFPTKPVLDLEGSERKLVQMIKTYKVDVIAIGNGTGSRESEQFVADVITKHQLPTQFTIVSEAGASVYSASKLANAEYPDIDVSIRGAISIAGRLQDPLSELVKIDPQSIGVGQYQHDVNQKRLAEVLDGVVEDAVNGVGVEVNTASEALLQYIAGVNAKTAKALVVHRNENGPFKKRSEILKVKGIGKAAYQQAAGFLRISDAKEILDQTGIHPESYDACKALMTYLGVQKQDIGNKEDGIWSKVQAMGTKQVADALEIHPILVEELAKELDKPGRDPREAMDAPILRNDVLSLADLSVGMKLRGTVRNVVDFGAFIDIGVKNDGMVHISELANKFVKHPTDVVQVGDVVDVTVIKIDEQRQKVALSMKQ